MAAVYRREPFMKAKIGPSGFRTVNTSEKPPASQEFRVGAACYRSASEAPAMSIVQRRPVRDLARLAPADRLRLRGCRPQAVAGHHLRQAGGAEATGCVGDVRDLEKVFRADVRGQDDEGACRFFMWIAEAVDGAPRRVHALARRQVARLVVDGVAQHAVEDIDHLLVVLVAVR